MKTLFQRHTTIIVTVFWMLIGLAVVGAQSHAAPPEPQVAAPLATATPVTSCPEWRKAGKWTMQICEDWELGVTCIHSDSGFMSCKWDN